MRYGRTESGIFTGVWLGLMILGRSQLVCDPGTLWHVVVGEEILSTGRFMTTDPLGYTYAGRPWFGRQWLAERGMALIHRAGQRDGLLLATATLLAALYTWTAHRLIGAGLHGILALLLVALALDPCTFHFHPRPHLATPVLLGWTFAQLCDFESGRTPLGRLFWLVPAFVVWTNANGGVLCGRATLALTAAGWGLSWMTGARVPVLACG
jgi:hypothetical protein